MNGSAKAGNEPLAISLAKYYIAREGYVLGAPPEAPELVAASDGVLTHDVGQHTSIICLIDRESNPGKKFTLPCDVVADICKRGGGRRSGFFGTRRSTIIQIIEVGPNAATGSDWEHLKVYKRKSVFSRVLMWSYAIDPVSKQVWGHSKLGRGRIARIVQSLPIPNDELSEQPPAMLEGKRFPWLTMGLLLLLTLIFVGEQFLHIDDSKGSFAPGAQSLVVMGGLNRALVLESGEWLRMLSAPLLHADPVHLFMNGASLYLAGSFLEPFVGRAWFMALFLLGALGGSAMSMLLNPPGIVSVGASGAIMGLLVAAYSCSFRIPIRGGRRSRLQFSILQALAPSLVPTFLTSFGKHIDYGAHLGGAIVGGIAGFIILKNWYRDEPLPRFRGAALAIAAVGALGFALALAPALRQYQDRLPPGTLMPNSEIPKNGKESAGRADDLVKRYPDDPRGYLFQAHARFFAGDPAGAEKASRAGLTKTRALAQLKPEAAYQLHLYLALALARLDRVDEARREAQPVCAAMAVGSFRTEIPVQGLLCGKQPGIK
ncbi:MAG: rhomboid family intramembrane serine protease [Magnetococcales bacterium]|nr:rhomboid family intramembrane serine protease [Magnetococcales bacterium]